MKIYAPVNITRLQSWCLEVFFSLSILCIRQYLGGRIFKKQDALLLQQVSRFLSLPNKSSGRKKQTKPSCESSVLCFYIP